MLTIRPNMSENEFNQAVSGKCCEAKVKLNKNKEDETTPNPKRKKVSKDNKSKTNDQSSIVQSESTSQSSKTQSSRPKSSATQSSSSQSSATVSLTNLTSESCKLNNHQKLNTYNNASFLNDETQNRLQQQFNNPSFQFQSIFTSPVNDNFQTVFTQESMANSFISNNIITNSMALLDEDTCQDLPY